VLPSKWVFKLDPYNKEAKKILAYLRKSLSPNYTLLVRGRGTRKEPGDEASLPLTRAEWAVVYVFRKDGTRRNADIETTKPPSLPSPKPATEPREKLPPGGSLNELIGEIKKREKASV